MCTERKIGATDVVFNGLKTTSLENVKFPDVIYVGYFHHMAPVPINSETIITDGVQTLAVLRPSSNRKVF